MSTIVVDTIKALDSDTEVSTADLMTRGALADPSTGSTKVGYKLNQVGSAVRTAYDKMAEVVSIKDFGGVGNGIVDESAAYQAACDWAAWYVSTKTDCSVVIHSPAGAYRLSTRAVCKVTATSSAQRSISFTGAGMYDTVLIANPENTSGFLKLGSVTNNEVWAISGMGFASDLPEDATTNNGIAIEIDTDQVYQGSGWGDRPLHTVWIKDVFVGGYHAASGFARRGNWAKAIRVYKKWNPKFINCRILTRYGKNPTNARTGGGGLKGIEVEACYSPWFQYVYVHGNWEYAVHLKGVHNASEDYEGGTFDHCNFVNSDYGVFWEHSYDTYAANKRYEPGGNIVACHFDCYKKGLWVRSHQQISIVATSVYFPADPTVTGGETISCGIHLEGAANIKIDSQFRGGYYNSDSDFSAAVRIDGYTDTIMIPSTFECAGVCVYNNSAKAEKTINVSGASFTRRVQEGTQLTQVKFMDLANGIFADYDEQVSEGGVWRKRKVLAASQTGTTTVVSHAIITNNKDYATVPNGGLGAYEVWGNNNAGTPLASSSIRTSWNANAAGAERGKVDILIQRDGALTQALQASYADTDLNSSFVAQFFIGSTWFTKRVVIGPADSGGAGFRALRVVN